MFDQSPPSRPWAFAKRLRLVFQESCLRMILSEVRLVDMKLGVDNVDVVGPFGAGRNSLQPRKPFPPLTRRVARVVCGLHEGFACASWTVSSAKHWLGEFCWCR